MPSYSTRSSSRTKFSKFCKFCFDLGLPPSKYESHFVRDIPGPKGVVICPEIKKLVCRECKGRGHTGSRCPRRRANVSVPRKIVKTDDEGFQSTTTVSKGTQLRRTKRVQSPSELSVTQSLFSELSMDSDSDCDSEDELDESEISSSPDSVNATPSYADILKSKETGDSGISDAALSVLKFVPASGGTAWADYSSDDEE